MEVMAVAQGGRRSVDLVPSKRSGRQVYVDVYDGHCWKDRKVYESRGSGEEFAMWCGEYYSLRVLMENGLAGRPS